MVLPAPGDGTLRAVLDWAQEWGRLPLPLDRPPWRSVSFEDVTVDGVPGRLVMVSQFHHAVIDGKGAMRLAEHFYQWAPRGRAAGDARRGRARHRPRRGSTGRPAGRPRAPRPAPLLRNTGRRLRWAAANPTAGLARAKALGAGPAADAGRAGHGPR